MSNVDLGRYKKIVKYFWDPEPKNDDTPQTSIWCLGREYRSSKVAEEETIPLRGTEAEEETLAAQKGQKPYIAPSKTTNASVSGGTAGTSDVTVQNGIDGDRGWPKDFLDDFESRLWLTYRSNFPAIPRSTDPKASASMSLSVRLRSQLDQAGFTSDTGWGCMIRSGQCVLANALAILRLGRDWRRGARQEDERRLLALFADDPKAPFSIHKFVEHGALACGKHPGEWFGPSATARCIQALSEQHLGTGLKVYMNGDGADVYEDTYRRMAMTDGNTCAPTLILVGIRLGIDRVTPAYWDSLKAAVRLPQSVGIAGGRPSSSHYFIGVQGDNFFYMDPHQTRTALPFHSDTNQYTKEEIDSCHTRRLRRISISEMDPSMLIAFFIKDEVDWKDWRESITKVSGKPVVHVADTEPSLHCHGAERASAVDDVEILDDEDEGDGEVIERPVP